MLFLVPLLTFALLCWTLRFRGWREALWSALLAIAVWVVALTEGLSAVGGLTPAGIRVGWMGAFGGMVWWTLAHRNTRRGTEWGGQAPAGVRREEWEITRGDKAVAGMLLVYAGVTLSIGLLAPPNNWDGMTYHLPRVMHWLQNGSLAPYPSAIVRQIYQPPFAEFALLHVLGVQGSDLLVAAVQGVAWLGCGVVVSLCARELGADGRGQLFAGALAVALPAAILQSTTVQNDLVAALFVCGMLLYLLRYHRSPDPAHLLGFAICLGLGALTKGTVYVLALPLAAACGILVVTRLRRGAWRAAAVGLVVVSGLNIGHLHRNTRAFGHPLGPRSADYANTAMGPTALASNLLRNVGMHSATGVRAWDDFAYGVVLYAHNRWLGLSVQDPSTSFLGRGYAPPRLSLHEDTAGNSLHLYLLVALVGMALVRPGGTDGGRWSVLVMAGAMLLLFSAVFKWQPWGTRLMLPIFVVACAWAGPTLAEIRPRSVGTGVMLLVLAGGFPWLLSSCTRPVIRLPGAACPGPGVFAPRVAQRFATRPGYHGPVSRAARLVEQAGCGTVGLMLGSDDWEYPLWVAMDDAALVHLTPGDHGSADVCAVVASTVDVPTLNVDGREFRRVEANGVGPDRLAVYRPVDP